MQNCVAMSVDLLSFSRLIFDLVYIKAYIVYFIVYSFTHYSIPDL